MHGDKAFGDRIKAARGFAGGISQGELAKRISEQVPGMAPSVRTIKRLENGDAGVKGSIREWSDWIGAATGFPPEMLLWGIDGPDQLTEEIRRWRVYSHAHWLRIAANLLWRLRRAKVDASEQRPLLERLRREGGLPLTGAEIESPSDALRQVAGALTEEEEWVREKERELLEKSGLHPRVGLADLPVRALFAFLNGQTLSAHEESEVRETVRWMLIDNFAPQHTFPVKGGKDIHTPFAIQNESPIWGPRGFRGLMEAHTDQLEADFADSTTTPAPPDENGRDLAKHLPAAKQIIDLALRAQSDYVGVPFPEGKLDRNLFVRYLSGETLGQTETAEIQRTLADPDVQRYFQAIAEKAGLKAPEDADEIIRGLRLAG